MNILKIILILTFLSIPSTILATEWNACSSGLSGVAEEVNKTEDIASELSRLEGEMGRLKKEQEACQKEPEIYDIYQDGCKGQRDEYNAMVDEYNAKLPEFKTVLYNMVETLKGSLPQCGY